MAAKKTRQARRRNVFYMFVSCFPEEMPRYCAVKFCRNRGGAAAREDNKRISFYPFPLQDKQRLQRWVDNMKREEWTPSRHQYLCSEHFTDDCFDIRWGIRYLKNTAIPTIFPSIEDDEDKKFSLKRSPKAKPRTLDLEPSGLDSPVSKRPLILSRTCKKVQSCSTNNILSKHTEGTFEAPLVLDSSISCHSSPSEVQTPDECGAPAASCLALTPSSEAETVTVLCCETLNPLPDQTFSFIPVEMVKEEAPDFYSEERGPSEGEHISVYEHAYCRPDTDKDQLWSKILSLHAKILELDRREENTVAKIRALESEVALLKRDGAVFKEKQKVLEDFISSVVL